MKEKILNLTEIEGVLQKEPEMFYTKNGVIICKMEIKVQQDEAKGFLAEITTWSKVAYYVFQYCKKGDCIRVKGKKSDENRKFHMNGYSVDFLKREQK